MTMLTKKQIEEIKARYTDEYRASGFVLEDLGANALDDTPALLAHIEALEGENERLREALRCVEVRMSNWGICVVCNKDYIEQGHADDCPFRALEGK